jgi:predicted lipoprotein with Yx(FWY)xxD motif
MKHLLAIAALLLATAASANPTVESNGVLASKDGRTLYTFDKDQAGKSNCAGGCLAAWPAFTVANPKAANEEFTIITRDDGTPQWAYKGMPLYFFAGDAKPGEINGDGQGGVWHVIRAKAAKAVRLEVGSEYSYKY